MPSRPSIGKERASWLAMPPSNDSTPNLAVQSPAVAEPPSDYRVCQAKAQQPGVPCTHTHTYRVAV
ncbi:uncharacterized protein SETTUDRAFT_162697 [Exserohilum turcica Et28A]|uniref:Uncharacterized protein n=1 Tax=Exserohilum turcicum (strain 28A) TaxID=671987 RepID=R0KHA4_EXST2|nr:uncharacterized protein SETTUDRAFT_162697 [Exserohilum turcica Et28A]EOA92263.1 hypothetical protein SETTUDRAFT_162697 [Exserohilum turcica Et28A]